MKKEEMYRPSVWNDMFLILVLTYFLSNLVVEKLISPSQFVFFILAIIAIIALRFPSKIISEMLRNGLSIAGIFIFFISLFYNLGPAVALAFGTLFGLMFLIYFFFRIGLKIFGWG